MSKKDKKRIRSLERKVERFESRLDNSDKDYISNEPKEVITCIVRVTAPQKKTVHNPIVNLINQYKLKHSFLGKGEPWYKRIQIKSKGCIHGNSKRPQ